jgi:hypothetical protein
MNIVRKHLSAVKGGQLLCHTGAGTILVLVLSDVPGDDLGTIASGPTSPDPSTFAQAREILEARALWPEIPERVRQRLLAGEKGEIPETPKPGDSPFLPGFPHSFGLRPHSRGDRPGLGRKARLSCGESHHGAAGRSEGSGENTCGNCGRGGAFFPTFSASLPNHSFRGNHSYRTGAKEKVAEIRNWRLLSRWRSRA